MKTSRCENSKGVALQVEVIGEALGVKTLIWDFSYVEEFVNFFLKKSYL